MKLFKWEIVGICLMTTSSVFAADRVISGNVNYDVKIDHDIVQATPKNANHTNQVLIIDNTGGNKKTITVGNPQGLGKNNAGKKVDPCSQTNRSDCQNKNLAQLKSDRQNLPNSHFENANLIAASFIGANLTNSSFENAQLKNANFTQAKLTNAQFGNADLSGARLSGATLTNADFSNANLTQADLSGAIIKNISLDNVNLSGARWVDGRICKPHSVGECL